MTVSDAKAKVDKIKGRNIQFNNNSWRPNNSFSIMCKATIQKINKEIQDFNNCSRMPWSQCMRTGLKILKKEVGGSRIAQSVIFGDLVKEVWSWLVARPPVSPQFGPERWGQDKSDFIHARMYIVYLK